MTEQYFSNEKAQAVDAAHFLRLGGFLAPSDTGSGVVVAVFESHVVPGQLELASTERPHLASGLLTA